MDGQALDRFIQSIFEFVFVSFWQIETQNENDRQLQRNFVKNMRNDDDIVYNMGKKILRNVKHIYKYKYSERK